MISVIMPVYLGEYEHCAKENRPDKFRRAINSFLAQEGVEKELVIIVDGCEQAVEICAHECTDFPEIRFHHIPKQEYFSGVPRNAGIERAEGELICYLDSDDFFGKGHLQAIVDQFHRGYAWVWWEDWMVTNYISLGSYTTVRREIDFDNARIGTSNIAHRRALDVEWGTGYGHDWFFVLQLVRYLGKEIAGTAYNVCHVPFRAKENHEV